MKRILFMVGGPEFHPVAAQAGLIAQWLGESFDCRLVPGQHAFQHLDSADLLVVMGLYWPGMQDAWAGSMTYAPLTSTNESKLEAYVRSGRPVLSHHGGIASYPESAAFAQACGFAWVWGHTTHSPFGSWTTRILSDAHPVMHGVTDFTIEDEIYYKVNVIDPARTQVHAVADFDHASHPMVSTREAHATTGRRVYLANGHDLRAFTKPADSSSHALRALWLNSVRWALAPL